MITDRHDMSPVKVMMMGSIQIQRYDVRSATPGPPAPEIVPVYPRGESKCEAARRATAGRGTCRK